MRLRKYAVTIMDNWTAARVFWTYSAARRFWLKHSSAAFLYHWKGGEWVLLEGPF